MGRNSRFARTAAEDDLAQADAAFMFAEEEGTANRPVATTTTTTSAITTTSAATAGTSSSSTRQGRKVALTVSLPGGSLGTATTTTTTTTATTTDTTTAAACAAAAPSGPAKRAPRAAANHPPPELPATARDVTDVASLARVVTLLSAAIEKAVHDGKSVTSANKRLISCAADEIRRAARALAQVSPAEQPTQPTTTTTTTTIPTPTDATGLDGVKKELVACVRAEINKLKAELVGARPGRPPPFAAAASNSQSYAQALGSGPARSPAAAHPAATPPASCVSKPAIIVATKAEVTSRQQAIEAFRRSISFRASSYAPARIQPVSKNKLRVEFDTDQQRDDALLRLGDASEVTAEPARTLKPMLILKGISRDTPSSELVDIVRRQNNCTSGELALRFERKNKNESLYSAVLAASPDVWRRLVDLGRVCVDHQRVHVEPFSPFVQCFACLQFGHVRKNCNSSAPKPCACCASTAHQEPDCPSKADRSSFKCFNCTHRNAKFNNSDSTNHKATSSYCSVLRAMRARVENRIDYGLP